MRKATGVNVLVGFDDHEALKEISERTGVPIKRLITELVKHGISQLRKKYPK